MVDLRRASAKASWRILPLLGLGYLVAFMDRANIAPSRAVVMGAYLVLSLVWTSVTLSTLTVTTAVVHRRLLAVGIAAMNTLSQIGAFVLPYGWGALKDETGAFTTGLYVLSGIVAVGVVLVGLLRRQVAGSTLPTLQDAAGRSTMS